MSRHMVRVYRLLFCVDDAKINCDLENEQQQQQQQEKEEKEKGKKHRHFMSAVEALCFALGLYLSEEKESGSEGDRAIRNTLFLYCFL